MPYLLLALGLIIGFYALSRFFVSASPQEIRNLTGKISLGLIALVIVFMAFTERLGPALVILVISSPLWMNFFRNIKPQKPSAASSSMSRSEAFEVLGLKSAASPEDIQSAYKKLMQKIHPDNEGSDWMAAKLNQARDILVKNP